MRGDEGFCVEDGVYGLWMITARVKLCWLVCVCVYVCVCVEDGLVSMGGAECCRERYER